MDEKEFRTYAKDNFVPIVRPKTSKILIEKVKELANKNHGNSMVFTFKNHPRDLIRLNEKVELLMTNTIIVRQQKLSRYFSELTLMQQHIQIQ